MQIIFGRISRRVDIPAFVSRFTVPFHLIPSEPGGYLLPLLMPRPWNSSAAQLEHRMLRFKSECPRRCLHQVLTYAESKRVTGLLVGQCVLALLFWMTATHFSCLCYFNVTWSTNMLCRCAYSPCERWRTPTQILDFDMCPPQIPPHPINLHTLRKPKSINNAQSVVI